MENPHQENQPIRLDSLPTEKLVEIIKFLKPQDLNFFKSTSAGFLGIVNDDEYWLGRLKSNFHLTDYSVAVALNELKKLGYKAKPNYADLYAYCYYMDTTAYHKCALHYLKDSGLSVGHLQGRFWLSPIKLLGLISKYLDHRAEKNDIEFNVLLDEIEEIQMDEVVDSVKRFFEIRIAIGNVSDAEYDLLLKLVLETEPEIVNYGIDKLISELTRLFNINDMKSEEYLKTLDFNAETVNDINIIGDNILTSNFKDFKP